MAITVAGRLAINRLKYALQKGERRDFYISVAAFRVAELKRLFRHRYGLVLPDDDAGREDIWLMLNHLAWHPEEPERKMAAWLSLAAPWLSVREVQRLIAEVLPRPFRFHADTLAKKLNLGMAERQLLRICTIGAVDLPVAQRKGRRKHEGKVRDARRRREAGAVPRDQYEANSISRAEPWKLEGVSRATWYRRRRTRSGDA